MSGFRICWRSCAPVTGMWVRCHGKSPALLPAFAAEAGLDARFINVQSLWRHIDALIATGSDDTRAWAEAQASAAGVPLHRCLLRGHRYSAAVIDGKEQADDRAGLAADALLHEGMGLP